MSATGVQAIRAFVPARDLETSRRFYLELGFQEQWNGGGACGLQVDGQGFILQQFHVKEHSENFMMQLMVDDVHAWWEKIQSLGLKEKYQLFMLKPPEMQPWGLLVLFMSDPSGVLWHIAQAPRK